VWEPLLGTRLWEMTYTFRRTIKATVSSYILLSWWWSVILKASVSGRLGVRLSLDLPRSQDKERRVLVRALHHQCDALWGSEGVYMYVRAYIIPTLLLGFVTLPTEFAPSVRPSVLQPVWKHEKTHQPVNVWCGGHVKKTFLQIPSLVKIGKK
jgi:multidrug efflux pump subunit AcrB